tara:strand:+ start:1287 stop:1994 length:708 start_codon:yes stop_codon:yes gene_type:complete
MKAVILCGGLGTRISQETYNKPKPMIKIGRIPILEHIINFYIKQNVNEVILLLGYKGKIIRNYFDKKRFKSKIKFIDTGLNTLTGERLLRAKKQLIKEERFMVTYGDGLCNVNLKKLLNFHYKHKKIATVTAVRPPARFGEIYIKKKNMVKKFVEKPQISSGWINGGFFIFNKDVFKYLSKKQMLEREPLTKLAKTKNLFAYKHHGFWQCMDTKRDHDLLKNMIKKNKKLPWTKI